MHYQPLDYKKWDFTGKGRNIIRLLSPIEFDIWKKALSYQDKRRDIGHAENVLYFALKLLDVINAKRELVILAAILHDVGWSRLSFRDRINALDSKHPNFLRDRLRHEKEGVKIAKKILKEVNYGSKLSSEILEIIEGHDTRKGFISKEDGVVRDADKIWRFTLTHHDVISKRLKESPKKYSRPKAFYNHFLKNITLPGFFYSDAAKEIAKIEIENTFKQINNL